MAKKSKKAGAQGGNLRTFYIVLAVLAIGGLGAIGYAIRGSAGQAVTEPMVMPELSDMRTLVEKAQGVTIGSPDAPVKLIVFSDYQCPYCGQFASQVKPLLEKNEIQAGKLQLVFYDFPLGGSHRHSFVAARAARCAGDQGKFWEYHDILFGQQSRWSPQQSAPITAFEEYARQIGLDGDAFGQCLKSDRYADIVTANRLLGDNLGVNGTPTVIINNKRVPSTSALNYRVLSEMIGQETGA